MAPHDHLLDNFAALDETRELAEELIRLAKLKTRPGSGHELGEFTTGLPAVCMLLASEQLNNGDVSTNSAQTASCLKKKDFKKVYDLVKAAVGEVDEVRSTYESLHDQYKSGAMKSTLKPFFDEAENEVMIHAPEHGHKSTMFKCVVYFWVCSAARLKSLTGTEVFATEQRLPLKKFISILDILNGRCLALQRRIKAASKSRTASPAKRSSVVATPQPSPRKSGAFTEEPNPSPVRRSSRSALLQESQAKSPAKHAPQTSPSKVIQPPRVRLQLGKGPIRELPSKDSPKKRVIESAQTQKDEATATDMNPTASDVESPTKKRKLASESPSKRTKRISSTPQLPASTSTVVTTWASPIKNAPTITFPSFSASARSSPQKSGLAIDINIQKTHHDAASSSDESDPEVDLSNRRFRPVYLDHKQWDARDPRLARIWKKADKLRKSVVALPSVSPKKQRRGVVLKD